MISNIHTHTVFCDGADTPDEMSQRAIELGFVSLGFSSHSSNGFDRCGMRDEQGYRRAVRAAAEKYGDRIEIYCGIEQDYYSGMTDPFYDYSIGSVHHIAKNGKYLAVDWSREETDRIVREEYGGDASAYAEDYYALVSRVAQVTGCAVVGHFDLITKFDEEGAVFAGARYESAAMRALESLCGKGLLFEINTGAIARGYRKTPYPAPWILEELRARGEQIVIASDCHDRRQLDRGFGLAAEAAKRAGFRSYRYLAGGEFREASL